MLAYSSHKGNSVSARDNRLSIKLPDTGAPIIIRDQASNKILLRGHHNYREKIMDLDQAIRAHGEWKIKFRSAISKQETMDVATISADNCCQLGKWLHGEAKQKFGTLKSHADCVVKHAAFHKEAGKVAQAINAKKYIEAEAMMDSGTTYTEASRSVGVAITNLKREASL